MAVGEAWQDFDLIFASEIGTPLDPDNAHLFSRICVAPVWGIGICTSEALGRVADAGAGHGSLRGVGGAGALQRGHHERRLRTPSVDGQKRAAAELMSRARIREIGS